MDRKRLFFAFNTQLLFLEVKHDFVPGRVWTHDKPIVSARFNKINNNNQV